jgi:hypothetical protein
VVSLRRSLRLLSVVLCLVLAIAIVSIVLNIQLLGDDVTKILPAIFR